MKMNQVNPLELLCLSGGAPVCSRLFDRLKASVNRWREPFVVAGEEENERNQAACKAALREDS